MKNNQKGIVLPLVIVLVIVVAAAIGIIFLLQKGGNSDNNGHDLDVVSDNGSATDNWTVYRNEAYKFQIKFPEDCVVNDAYLGAQYAFAVGITSPKWADSTSAVVIVNHGNVGTFSLKDWVNKQYKTESGAASNGVDAKFVGEDAVLVRDKNKVSYFMLKGMDVYEVYKKGSEKTLDGILKTFMFLD